MFNGNVALKTNYDFIELLSKPLSGSSDNAQIIQKKINKIKDYKNETVSLGWRKTFKNEIEEIYSTHNTDNWDNEGAYAISLSAKNTANFLIDLIPDNTLPPTIYAEETGDISFDWRVGENIIFSISASEDSFIYAGIFGGEKKNGAVKFTDELPKQLSEPINNYLQKTL